MNRLRAVATPVGLAIGLSLLYLATLGGVPYHPDETSQLVMSRDIARDWSTLGWRAGEPITGDVRLRLLDAPLTRWVLGLSWSIAGFSADQVVAVDWQWGATWEDNAAAQPDPQVLWAARVGPALLTGLTAGLLVWIGQQLGGWSTGVLAGLLFGLHPLVLLHGRRAMAEPALMFSTTLAAAVLIALLHALARAWPRPPVDDGPRPEPPSPWRVVGFRAAVVGLAIGLSASAKQTGAVMALAAGLSVTAFFTLRVRATPSSVGQLAGLLGLMGVIALATFFVLNPVLYADPIQAATAMVRLRQELMAQQLQVNDPAMVLADPVGRLAAALRNLWFEAPKAWDAPVYLEHLQPAANAYFAWPLMAGWPQPVSGILALGALGLGLAAAVIAARRGQPAAWVLLSWTGAVMIGLALTIPLDWQRYFLPLLPPACALAAFGVVAFASARGDGRALGQR